MRALFHPALNGGEASDWLRPTPCQREGDKLLKGAYQSGNGYSTGVHLLEHLACVPSSRRESSHASSQGKEATSVTHDIYMGFGIFLQLKKRKNPELIRILGTISSDDPEVRTQLHLLVKSEKHDDDHSLLNRNIIAAAGNESQLQCVKQELSQGISQKGCISDVTLKPHPTVKITPSRVILNKLSDATIRKYTKRSEGTSIETVKQLHLKKLTIPVKHLLLTPSQSVHLQPPRKTPSLKKDTATKQITKKSVKRKCYISGHPS